MVKQYLLDLVLDMQYVPVADDAAYGRALEELQRRWMHLNNPLRRNFPPLHSSGAAGAVMAPQGTFDTYYSQYLLFMNNRKQKTFEAQIRALFEAVGEAAR